jgi:hypothetical protein
MQQEARDAAVAVRAAAFENPPVFARDLVEIDLAAFASGFDAAWRARGEADRAAVEQVSGPVMIGGEAITALGDALAAIAVLGEEQ